MSDVFYLVLKCSPKYQEFSQVLCGTGCLPHQGILNCRTSQSSVYPSTKKLIELFFPSSQILSIAFQPKILAWNWNPFAAEDISVANNKHILVKKNMFLFFSSFKILGHYCRYNFKQQLKKITIMKSDFFSILKIPTIWIITSIFFFYLSISFLICVSLWLKFALISK